MDDFACIELQNSTNHDGLQGYQSLANIFLIVFTACLLGSGAVSSWTDAKSTNVCFNGIERLERSIVDAKKDAEEHIRTSRLKSLGRSVLRKSRFTASRNSSVRGSIGSKVAPIVAFARKLSKSSSVLGFAGFNTPMDVLTKSEVLPTMAHGFEPPSAVSLIFEEEQVLRAKEDADACSKQARSTRTQKIREILGITGIALEPVFTLATLSNANLRTIPGPILNKVRSYFMLGVDIDIYFSSASEELRFAVSLLFILEGLGMLHFLLHFCWPTLAQRWRLVKFELMLVPFMKGLTTWVVCQPCQVEGTGQVTETLVLLPSMKCWEGLHILPATAALVAIANTFYRAIMYTRHERNAKNPVIRFNPEFILSLYSVKVASVLLVMFMGKSANRVNVNICLSLIFCLHVILAFVHYKQVPCYGARLSLNNYRFTGLVITALFSLVLLVADILNDPNVHMAGSVLYPLSAIISWIVSNRRAKLFALREFVGSQPKSRKLEQYHVNMSLDHVVDILNGIEDKTSYSFLVGTILLENVLVATLGLTPLQLKNNNRSVEDIRNAMQALKPHKDELLELEAKYAKVVVDPGIKLLPRLYTFRGLEAVCTLCSVLDCMENSTSNRPTKVLNTVRQFSAKLMLNKERWPLVYQFVAVDGIRLYTAVHSHLTSRGLLSTQVLRPPVDSIELVAIPPEMGILQLLIAVMRNLENSKWETYSYLAPINLQKDNMRISLGHIRTSCTTTWVIVTFCLLRHLVSSSDQRLKMSKSRLKGVMKKMNQDYTTMVTSGASSNEYKAVAPLVTRILMLFLRETENVTGAPLEGLVASEIAQSFGSVITKPLQTLFLKSDFASHHAAYRVGQLLEPGFVDKNETSFIEQTRHFQEALVAARVQVERVRLVLANISTLETYEGDELLRNAMLSLLDSLGLLFVVSGHVNKYYIYKRIERLLAPLQGMALHDDTILNPKGVLEMVKMKPKSWFNKLKWKHNLKLSGLNM